MEGLLIIVFQLLYVVAEILFNVFLWSPFGLAEEKLAKRLGLDQIIVSMLFLGALAGFVSIRLISHVLIDLPSLRMANLVLTPLVGGWVAHR